MRVTSTLKPNWHTIGYYEGKIHQLGKRVKGKGNKGNERLRNTLWSDASGVKKMEVRSVDGVFKGRQ